MTWDASHSETLDSGAASLHNSVHLMRRTITEPVALLEALAQLFPDSSRTTLRQMLAAGRVRVDGGVERDARRLLAVNELLDVAQKPSQRALPLGLGILHEDRDVLVVLKANGLLTVATERETKLTAQAFLNDYLKENGEPRVHVVHRIDRETSGVLVFAKTFGAREVLKQQFAEHSVDRLYVAVIEGGIVPPSGTIRSYLFERKNLRMTSIDRLDQYPSAKLAVTHYETVKRARDHSMLEVKLETGRKNQIRAHLSEAGHPIAGDVFYGAATNPLGRLGLHAARLGFDHPSTGERMTFSAPLPRSFVSLFGN